MKRRVRVLLILAFCCKVLFLHSQNFSGSAALPEIPHSGFYKIVLPTALTTISKPDFADVRILSSDSNAIPFLIQNEEFSFTAASFNRFLVISNRTDSLKSILEFEANVIGIDELVLRIANTEVGRHASLSGSNDRNQWYIVAENLHLAGNGDQHEGKFLNSVSFPFSQYKYYRLLINNRGTDPLNILEVGLFEKSPDVDRSLWLASNLKNWKQVDSSNSKSYVFIQNVDGLVERLRFEIARPRFYARHFKVYVGNPKEVRNIILQDELQSTSSNTFQITAIKPGSIVVEIENGDNPPLQIRRIQTEQRKRYLIAYLESGNQYTLFAGNPALNAPQYDLARFSDSIPSSIPILSAGVVRKANQLIASGKAKNVNWVWIALIVGICILALLTYKLASEMKKKEL